MKTKKLNLEIVTVKSFVTTLDSVQKETISGGAATIYDPTISRPLTFRLLDAILTPPPSPKTLDIACPLPTAGSAAVSCLTCLQHNCA